MHTTHGTSAATAHRNQEHVLIVIPTLNERVHIEAVLDLAARSAQRLGGRVVVADGGSTDGTRAIVQRHAAENPAIVLMDNHLRLQSAGLNTAVSRFGQTCEWVIRLDAHATYPDNFCDVLLSEAQATGAASVVVAMHADGTGFWQRVIAAAQNARLGNGGAQHRVSPRARFVEHGHHALMRVSAFQAVGGYDPTFSHNEDAELDMRLVQAGFRIWLTDQTSVTYHPRRTLGALARQYFMFGRGRARTALKHRGSLKLRHAALILLAPMLLLAVLAPISLLFATPAAIWSCALLAASAALAVQTRTSLNLLSGLAAGLMQLAWSCGFCFQTAKALRRACVPLLGLRAGRT